MPLVEPGPTGLKTEAEAVAAIEGGNPGQKRRLGLTFWLSAGWIFTLVFLALFRDILPIRDPDELGIRTREVAKFESPGGTRSSAATAKAATCLPGSSRVHVLR